MTYHIRHHTTRAHKIACGRPSKPTSPGVYGFCSEDLYAARMAEITKKERESVKLTKRQKNSLKTQGANKHGQTLQQVIDALTEPKTSKQVGDVLGRLVGSFRFALVQGENQGMITCDKSDASRHVWSLTDAGRARQTQPHIGITERRDMALREVG